MKTTIIFVVGFAVLAVAIARVTIEEATNDTNEPEPARRGVTFEQVLLGAADWSQQNDPEYREALNAKPEPSTDEPVPSPNSLVLKSDPNALGKQIAELPKDEQSIYIKQLKNLIKENRGTMQAHFYKAALKAIHSPDEKSQDWNEHVQKAKDYGRRMVKHFPEIGNLFDDNTPLATISYILKANPLRAAKRSGIPIKLYIAADSSGSFDVASSFNTISSSDGRVKGSIQRLILERIAEGGGVEEFHRKYFNSPPPEPPKEGQR